MSTKTQGTDDSNLVVIWITVWIHLVLRGFVIISLKSIVGGFSWMTELLEILFSFKDLETSFDLGNRSDH